MLYPKDRNNVVIVVSGKSNKPFSCLAVNIIADVQMMFNGQCFPLYYYEETSSGKFKCHDAITDETLEVFRKAYPEGFTNRRIKDGGPEINKEDIFYYIYGILHSPEYRKRFESNLKKELPRIPLSKKFREFSMSGKALADLHIHYEEAEMYPLEAVGDETNPGHVQKMKWAKKRDTKTGKSVDDKTVLIYNGNLTFKGIPESANRYIVNGRSPLEWMIDRYQVKTDKASGIVNDPNEYSEDPCYIIHLIKRLVTVSVRTMEIVDTLPNIDEMDRPEEWPEAWKGNN